MRRCSLSCLSGLALMLGTGLLLYGSYIPAKAWLAQRLLDTAWERRLAGDRPVRPWPWADTSPLARLQQPRLGVDQIVLEGASGRVLAFGPGHVGGSARPGRAGNVVISGHRDTHFRWLAELEGGDALILESADGRQRNYRVVDTAIHHETDTGLLDPLAGDQLRLLTCYPFDAVDPGTDLRYVVTALPARVSLL
jgi:sortase A